MIAICDIVILIDLICGQISFYIAVFPCQWSTVSFMLIYRFYNKIFLGYQPRQVV
jgi:hypothetical protein